MRGRWAQGLEPRSFCWIIKDHLAASERPGGFARNHRKVRRQEELIWLAGNGFTHVLSLLDSPHNLHAYDEAGIAYEHVPLGRRDEWPEHLRPIYETLASGSTIPRRRCSSTTRSSASACMGVLAGFLLYTGKVTEGPHAIVVIEKITGRQLGAAGREIVAVDARRGPRRESRRVATCHRVPPGPDA